MLKRFLDIKLYYKNQPIKGIYAPTDPHICKTHVEGKLVNK